MHAQNFNCSAIICMYNQPSALGTKSWEELLQNSKNLQSCGELDSSDHLCTSCYMQHTYTHIIYMLTSINTSSGINNNGVRIELRLRIWDREVRRRGPSATIPYPESRLPISRWFHCRYRWTHLRLPAVLPLLHTSWCSLHTRERKTCRFCTMGSFIMMFYVNKLGLQCKLCSLVPRPLPSFLSLAVR